jgi:hypothetical protein
MQQTTSLYSFSVGQLFIQYHAFAHDCSRVTQRSVANIRKYAFH